jgi:hypothetical protein
MEHDRTGFEPTEAKVVTDAVMHIFLTERDGGRREERDPKFEMV